MQKLQNTKGKETILKVFKEWATPLKEQQFNDSRLLDGNSGNQKVE